MNKNWEIGQKVLYHLPNGNRVCTVIKSTPSQRGPRGEVKSHYVELLDIETNEMLFSAYDENLSSYL